ncbi:hypothetical protein ABC345_03300 [Shouchella sp. 1P09AA]|uniref:hypothetical protein n=1 Tax=unclassified Shouchella TaxID=2893065 RepID=UPI0039A0048C
MKNEYTTVDCNKSKPNQSIEVAFRTCRDDASGLFLFKARVLQAEVFASLNQELERVEDVEVKERLQDIEAQLRG